MLRLKNEIGRLKSELQAVLDHTIQSDTRLLQFTDEIFVANLSTTDPKAINKSTTSAMVECGVQCELTASHNSSDTAAGDTSANGCPKGQPAMVTNLPRAEQAELINSLKTTIEVLTAENQYLKLKQKTCECSDSNHNQPWTEVKNKKKKDRTTTHRKFDKNNNSNKTPSTQQKVKIHPNKCHPSQPNKNQISQNPKQLIPRTKLRYKNVTISGDSHTRHIARLIGGLVDPSTTVIGHCKPGARLLDVVQLDRQPPTPMPGPRCEVLIAGTNDLAAGTQHNVYRHLERFITTRPAGTELVIATIPKRHDLKDPHNPIHDETDLLNAYIEELAVRHNFKTLNMDGIPRRHFTRHGQHLSMNGKWLMANLLMKNLCRPICQPTPPKHDKSSPMTSSVGAIIRPGQKTFAEAVARSSSVTSSPAFSLMKPLPTPAKSEREKSVPRTSVREPQGVTFRMLPHETFSDAVIRGGHSAGSLIPKNSSSQTASSETQTTPHNTKQPVPTTFLGTPLRNPDKI